MLIAVAIPVRAMVETGAHASAATVTSEPAADVAAPTPEIGIDDAAGTPDASELSHSLLARMAFEDLGLQLIGVASFGDRTSCFIRSPGAATPQTLSEGDPIGDFRVVSIAADSVTLERDRARFELALGGGSEEAEQEEGLGAAIDEDLEPHAEPDPLEGVQQEINELLFADLRQIGEDAQAEADGSALSIKTASASLKSRTARFQTAKVIHDAWSGAKIGRRPGAPHFIMPVRARITSGFGYRRHPMGGGRRMHNGIDLAAPYGTSVRAAADGTVSRAGYNGALGRYVYVRHANGYETRYGHLSARLVKTGQKVSQGDAIGREGSTGNSTGPHLHFEIRKDGRALNPTYYLDK